MCLRTVHTSEELQLQAEKHVVILCSLENLTISENQRGYYSRNRARAHFINTLTPPHNTRAITSLFIIIQLQIMLFKEHACAASGAVVLDTAILPPPHTPKHYINN